jgi:hypothetical protein
MTNYNKGKKDLAAARTIEEWCLARTSTRVAWKRVGNLASIFGFSRLTRAARQRLTVALAEKGLFLDPPLDGLSSRDIVHIHRVETLSSSLDEPIPSTSDRLPDQIIAWDVSNMGDGDGVGEWLRCLKGTKLGDRQFIWESSSHRGIVGVVTYAGHVRHQSGYEAWGSFEPPRANNVETGILHSSQLWWAWKEMECRRS